MMESSQVNKSSQEGPVDKWTVPRLKSFLSARKITCSGHTKPELVLMVTQAMRQPGLAALVLPQDSDAASRKRRTVEMSGEEIVFPDPNTLSGWDNNLNGLPVITTAHALMYLMMKRDWPKHRLQKYEQERGYQLFLERHIQDVVTKKVLDNIC